MPGSKVGRITSVTSVWSHMTSDLLSKLEVCFKWDALNKSMFTLLYFTYFTMNHGNHLSQSYECIDGRQSTGRDVGIKRLWEARLKWEQHVREKVTDDWHRISEHLATPFHLPHNHKTAALGMGCCTFPTVPRSNQPSTLHEMVK